LLLRARCVPDRFRALLIRRRDNQRWEPPGGILELGESIHKAASRTLMAASAGDNLTFSLAWPAAGIGYTEHQVTGVRDAAQRAVTLWSAGPGP
jgi:8-oxo-dGTP pyrophosphatase MutT (NUDIX family)